MTHRQREQAQWLINGASRHLISTIQQSNDKEEGILHQSEISFLINTYYNCICFHNNFL